MLPSFLSCASLFGPRPHAPGAEPGVLLRRHNPIRRHDRVRLERRQGPRLLPRVRQAKICTIRRALGRRHCHRSRARRRHPPPLEVRDRATVKAAHLSACTGVHTARCFFPFVYSSSSAPPQKKKALPRFHLVVIRVRKRAQRNFVLWRSVLQGRPTVDACVTCASLQRTTSFTTAQHTPFVLSRTRPPPRHPLPPPSSHDPTTPPRPYPHTRF